MPETEPTPAQVPIAKDHTEVPIAKDHTIGWMDPLAQRVWNRVSESPLGSMWDFEGMPVGVVWKRTLKASIDDNLFSRAAELGFYFLFALFPMLVSMSAILGLVARHGVDIYVRLLHYLTLMVPRSAYALVIETFNQATSAATSGKVTLGLATALWSASVGFSAIQDGMNTVYKVRESRAYWKARGAAILVTLLLAVVVTLCLTVLLGGDLLARLAVLHLWHRALAISVEILVRIVCYAVALALILMIFNLIYFFAPDLHTKRWHWITPGAVAGIAGWIAASLGLRLYLHYFLASFSLTYGSLGAVIVLLTWFYITGLMLLLGAELNSEIHAAVMERRLKAQGELPVEAEVRG